MTARTGGVGEFSDVVEVVNPNGTGPFVLLCEHASNAIPDELAHLGLDAEARQSHIAWDPGARAVAGEMSALLNAPLIAPRVSRLVFDCNRPTDSPSAIPHSSEAYAIPGNKGLSADDCRARADRYYRPFHETVRRILDARAADGQAAALLTIHSFTPVYHGQKREVELGILHDADARLADALLKVCAVRGDFITQRNVPYGPDDDVTNTLAEQALPRG
ncbi:MAG: N-formylglutamate amidohydrolase, partial [Arenibacter algicola]|nr:N-formylglutamate amidohydrolase [Arenibacter algicola]